MGGVGGGGCYGSMQINDSDVNIWWKQVIVSLQSSSEQLAATYIHSVHTKKENETNVQKTAETEKQETSRSQDASKWMEKMQEENFNSSC